MTTVLTVTSSAIVSSSLVYRNAIFLHLKTNQTKKYNTTAKKLECLWKVSYRGYSLETKEY